MQKARAKKLGHPCPRNNDILIIQGVGMKQSLELYNQVDWWNPKHSLLQIAPVKFDYFFKKIGNLTDINVLDIGCGGGLLSEKFAKQGAKVTGIDVSQDSINVAIEHALKNNLTIDYKLGSAENIPSNDDFFDAVICADCLEHVDDLDKVINEISRVLKINGIFCYDTINRNIFSKIFAIWIGNRVLRWQYKKLNVTENNYAVHDWNKCIKPKELFYLFGKYNLSNIEIKGIQFAGVNKNGILIKIGDNTIMSYIGYAQKK